MVLKKNKKNEKRISDFIWKDIATQNFSILKSVKAYCQMEDGSILSEEEENAIADLIKNPFVQLIFAAGLEEGYDSF